MNEPEFVTKEELQELRAKINKSLEQLVRLTLQVKKRIDAIDERLATYNQRSGHKI